MGLFIAVGVFVFVFVLILYIEVSYEREKKQKWDRVIDYMRSTVQDQEDELIRQCEFRKENKEKHNDNRSTDY